MTPAATSKSATLRGQDFLTVADLTADQLRLILETAARIKQNPADHASTLAGRSIIMLFEKPSLRTRVSFEVGIVKLGGHAIYFDHAGSRIGERESIQDYARNLERWVDAIIARTFAHDTLTQLAEHASIPVINALSDLYHPCQALADYLTIQERFGTLEGRRLAYIGDGNNVCHSLLLAGAALGVGVTVISPPGYGPDPKVVDRARTAAQTTGAQINTAESPSAVEGHDAVYTDTWVSMGQEGEQQRRNAFEPYRVTEELMKSAGPNATFMHCLPATRGQEVTDEVIDSDRSLVYDQAENRMHAQNGLLALLLANPNS